MKKLSLDRNTALLLKCEMVKYLDGCGYMRILQREVEKYSWIQKNIRTRFPPFNCPIYLDHMDLLDKSVLLATWFSLEPICVSSILQDVIATCVHVCIVPHTHQVHSGQVHSTLRCSSAGGKLTVLSNVVLQGVGPSVSYIKQSAWMCLEECKNTKVVLPCIPKRAPLCDGCNMSMVEMQAGRDHGTKVVAVFFNSEVLAPKGNDNTGVSFGREVWICDEMIQNLELGCTYDLTIYPSNYRPTTWNLERHKLPLYPPIPRRGSQMFGAWLSGDGHPWSAVVAASHLVTRSVSPDGTFMHLCMGLVLSLASIQEEEEGHPLQILAVGHDFTKLGAIMEKMSQFARRVTYGHPGCSLSGQVRKDRSSEAGALILARGGVCMMGNLALHTHSSRGGIMRSAVASGRITLDGEVGASALLKCSVWTYWEGVQSNKDKLLLHTLHNLFGIILPANEEDISLYLLERAVNPGSVQHNEAPSITNNTNDKDLKSHIRNIAKWQVTMEPDAESLMRNYFLVLRKDRPDEVPQRALQVLDKISRANARLSMRTVATCDDVLLSAFLYQKSLSEMYGDSGLSDAPYGDMKTMKDVNKTMRDFKNWLAAYMENVN